MQDVAADLERLAGQVASRLVVRALQQLVGGAVLPLAITVHAERVEPAVAQKRLGPGRTTPGPKPGTRRAKPVAPPTPVAARLRKIADAQKAGGGTNLAARQCRKCFKAGTAQPLGDGRVKCSSCGHEWTLRRSKFETVAPAPPTKPSAKAAAGCCTRCDHSLTKHVDFSGACLVPRCICAEAVE